MGRSHEVEMVEPRESTHTFSGQKESMQPSTLTPSILKQQKSLWPSQGTTVAFPCAAMRNKLPSHSACVTHQDNWDGFPPCRPCCRESTWSNTHPTHCRPGDTPRTLLSQGFRDHKSQYSSSHQDHPQPYPTLAHNGHRPMAGPWGPCRLT